MKHKKNLLCAAPINYEFVVYSLPKVCVQTFAPARKYEPMATRRPSGDVMANVSVLIDLLSLTYCKTFTNDHTVIVKLLHSYCKTITRYKAPIKC